MTGMYDPCVERIKEFWQEMQPVVGYENWPDDLFLATVCSHVYVVINHLMLGKVQRAKEELWATHHMLVTSRTAAEEPELLRQALYILDIGHFAWALAAYSRHGWALAGNVRCCCDILRLAKEIWKERETFALHLSDALRAAYIFMLDLKYVPPWRAFRYALKSSNYMYEYRGYSIVHGNKPIGYLLGAAAMGKLKEILRAYVRERNSGDGSRP